MCTLCQTPIVSVVYRKKRLNTIIRAISHIDTQKDGEYMLEGVGSKESVGFENGAQEGYYDPS